MEDMVLRCSIRRSFRRFYIGRGSGGELYLIYKNSLNSHFKIDEEYSFCAYVKRGIFYSKVYTVTEEQIGY